MLITTSAVTGGFPKPALPPLVFRSIYQVPPPSPAQRVKRAEKAARSAMPSLSVAPVGRPRMLCQKPPLVPRDAPSTACRGRGQASPEAALGSQSWWQPALLPWPRERPVCGRTTPGRAAAPRQRLRVRHGGQQLPALPKGARRRSIPQRGRGAALLRSGTGLQRLLFEHTRCLLLGKAAQAMGLPDNSN